MIGKRVENSAFLMLLAAVISIPLSILIGAVTARRRDGKFDHTMSVGLLGLAALPEFVVAILLIVLLGTTVFQVLPAVSLIPPDDHPWQHMNEMVLPVLTLVIAVTPYVSRIMRASMVEVLESDYVEMARLKGMSERKVLWRHAVPNAIAPTIQVIALNLAYLAGGIVVVEFVFGYPGIGAAFVDAVANRDIPVVQALAILIAALYVVLNVARRRRHDPRQPAAEDVAAMSEAAAVQPMPALAVADAAAPGRAAAAARLAADAHEGRRLHGPAPRRHRRHRPVLRPPLAVRVRRHPLRAPLESRPARDRQSRPGRLHALPLGRPVRARPGPRRDGDRPRARRDDRAGGGVRPATADDFLMRAMDVILAFPSLVLALVAVATVGPQLWLLVLVVGITTAPRVSRVTRGSSVEIVERDFVRAAEAMGESRRRILLGEILPNVASPLLVEASLRLTYSIGLIAALSFLGFGLQPPAADWGLMINENRQGADRPALGGGRCRCSRSPCSRSGRA